MSFYQMDLDELFSLDLKKNENARLMLALKFQDKK